MRQERPVKGRGLIFLLLSIVLVAGSASASVDSGERASVIAGTWYSADPVELTSMIRTFLDQANPSIPRDSTDTLMGLVVPHAGYAYSGPVAAYGFKLLENKQFDTVVIIGPSHRAAFDYVSVYDKGGYRTPLGLVPLDREFIDMLKVHDAGLRYIAKAHGQEHSVEIELPFLQVVQPGCRIVPLVMGAQSMSACERLAAALFETIRSFAGKKRVLLVASSDLSHYHDAETAKEKDRHVINALNSLNPDTLLHCLATRSCEACGGGPILTVMKTLMRLGANKGVVLNYGDSGDTTGDKQRVVGYLAAAILQGPSQNSTANEATQRISLADRKLLHEIVRQSIKARLDGKPYVLPKIQSALLNEPGAAFVTLKKKGQLRGCIGYVVAREPLAQSVSEMALAAAFEDPRFPPLQKAEYGELSYEVSVLTPMTRILDPGQVQVGIHGLLLRKGGRSGLLLPQVPVEYGWNREEFLDNTCRKAGLDKGCWKDTSTELYTFSAEVF